jgi:hypothetical protein
MLRDEQKPDYGPAVVDGFVRRTSVSALMSFDPESYAGCPRRWWWQRVAGKKEPETKAQGEGKLGHAQNETYLKTGQDVLGPIARAGKHLMPVPGPDLAVEAQFGDLGRALELREMMRNSVDPRDEDQLLDEMREAAGLTAGAIPLDGYIDLKHSRGEWIDNAGALRPEDPSLGRVVEVIDHKFTSNIAYGKSPGELAESIQMAGYANYIFNIDPNADHTRISHIYYQTRGPKAAKKVTAILSRNAAREKWRRVDQLAVYMEEVARATSFEQVEAQPKSCNSFKEGCPHRSYCPVKLSFGKNTNTGGNEMSLFGNVMKQQSTNGTTNGASSTSAPTTAPTGSLFGSIKKAAPSEDRTAVDQAKARFAAEDAQPAVQYGFCQGCGAKLDAANASKLPSGLVKHIGCPTSEDKTVVAMPLAASGQIVPPDAAKSTLAQSAQPLPASALAEVTDPEILARNEALKQAQAQTSAPVTTEKKGGRCPAGGTEQKLTPKEATARKTKCATCGVDYKIKDEEFNADCTAIKLRNHNMPKVETPAPMPAPVTQTAVAQQPAPQTVVERPLFSSTIVEVPAQQSKNASLIQAQTGIAILVDCLKERGPRPTPLEDYWRPMVTELERQAGGCDLRCAPNDTPVGYGKWRGLLATWVRENPPGPGVYFARGGNDFDSIVVDALSSVADVTRGVR